ncbi:MAG: AMP-binding protein [Rhizomicrobium sp.]|jgi:crotonobetaine/carnitine-CoA ligase
MSTQTTVGDIERQLLPQLVAHRARTEPDRVLINVVDGVDWTNRTFHALVMKWVAALRRFGVERGDTVVTMADLAVDGYAAWLAISWLGATEVPLNTGYRGDIIKHVVRTSGATKALVQPSYVERFVELGDAAQSITRMLVLGSSSDVPDAAFEIVDEATFFKDLAVTDESALVAPRISDIGCMILTSGTTGPSKVVRVPWGQLYYGTFHSGMSAVENPQWGMGENSAYYSFYPLFHNSGRYALYFAAAHRSRVVLRNTFSVENYWSDVRRYRCTHTLLLAPMMSFLLSKEPRPDDRDHTLRSVIGGPIGPVLQKFIDRFDVHLSTGFGMTETGGPLHQTWQEKAPTSSGFVSKGPPGFEVRLVDDDDYPVCAGEVGELIVRTSEPWAMNSGYHNMPEQTAQAWRNGWFHTGDAFRQDATGAFHFVDRKKDCIRRRGENISSFEVENYVVRHPGVVEVAAVGAPSEYGEEEVKVFVVAQRDKLPDEQTLWRFLKDTMPKFMTPRFIEFVSELPKTDATARIQKIKLKARPNTTATWDAEKSIRAA